jgi:hypothetical protein
VCLFGAVPQELSAAGPVEYCLAESVGLDPVVPQLQLGKC